MRATKVCRSLLAGWLLFASPALAAIAVDGSSIGSNSSAGGATGFQYSTTLAVGDTLEVATVGISNSCTVSGITLGGVAYTTQKTQLSANGLYNTYLFWWLNPPTGTNFLNVQYGGCTPAIATLRSAAYSGVANTTVPSTITPISSSTTTFTTNTVTPCASGSWVIGFMENSTVAITAGTGTLFRAGSGNGDGLFDSNGTVTGASSLQGTSGSAQTWTGMTAAFSPTSCSVAATAKPLFQSIP